MHRSESCPARISLGFINNFRTSDVRILLQNKFVVFIGDSVVRCMYKDLLLLLKEDRILDYGELRKRGERGFLGDELMEGGELGMMCNGKNYREVRQYCSAYHMIRFYFITRTYNTYVEAILAELATSHMPSVIIMNSCLWDITRYGANGMNTYKEHLSQLFCTFERLLQPETLVIWTTALPVSETVRGGVILEQIRFLSDILRLDVLLANFYACQVATNHGFDTLDLHYFFRRRLDLRLGDGIHWNAAAHRAMTNLILYHVCDAWGILLPQRFHLGIPLEEQQAAGLGPRENEPGDKPQVENQNKCVDKIENQNKCVDKNNNESKINCQNYVLGDHGNANRDPVVSCASAASTCMVSITTKTSPLKSSNSTCSGMPMDTPTIPIQNPVDGRGMQWSNLNYPRPQIPPLFGMRPLNSLPPFGCYPRYPPMWYPNQQFYQHPINSVPNQPSFPMNNCNPPYSGLMPNRIPPPASNNLPVPTNDGMSDASGKKIVESVGTQLDLPLSRCSTASTSLQHVKDNSELVGQRTLPEVTNKVGTGTGSSSSQAVAMSDNASNNARNIYVSSDKDGDPKRGTLSTEDRRDVSRSSSNDKSRKRRSNSRESERSRDRDRRSPQRRCPLPSFSSGSSSRYRPY